MSGRFLPGGSVDSVGYLSWTSVKTHVTPFYQGSHKALQFSDISINLNSVPNCPQNVWVDISPVYSKWPIGNNSIAIGFWERPAETLQYIPAKFAASFTMGPQSPLQVIVSLLKQFNITPTFPSL